MWSTIILRPCEGELDSDLLLMLRTQEDRQTAKANRMKKHISSTKQRVSVNSQSTCVCAELKEKSETPSSATEDLKQQIASLQSQLASLVSQKKTKSNTKRTAEKLTDKPKPGSANTGVLKQTKGKQTSKPKAWYCFHCGEDGHIAPSCTNAANPALVMEKRKQVEEKLLTWEMQSYPQNPNPPLN